MGSIPGDFEEAKVDLGPNPRAIHSSPNIIRNDCIVDPENLPGLRLARNYSDLRYLTDYQLVFQDNSYWKGPSGANGDVVGIMGLYHGRNYQARLSEEDKERDRTKRQFADR